MGNCMSIITLTTDFGTREGYVGTIKGVLLSIAPQARLVDISHEIEPHDIRQAAYVLAAAAPYFPSGTLHLAVVDPGVGSARRALVIRTSRAFLVGPDNGLFTLLLQDEPDAECYAITHPAFMLPRVSATFHGRDVFAPAAAHLACGVSPAEFGPRVTDAVRLALPQPVQQPDGTWLGQVLYADHFGNLVTSIRQEHLHSLGHIEITLGQQRLTGLQRTYAESAPGELIALVGSSGHLEISVVKGNAAHTLGLGPDAPILVRIE
jgi:S-adenosylmethionine hydrolase